MKNFKLLSFLLIFVLAVSLLPVSALAVDYPAIGADAAVVMDTDTGEVYCSINGNSTIQPASTTKIMTALLVVEAVESGTVELSDEVTAHDDCQYNMDETSSHADPIIEPGEILTVEDLLYCAMLSSANEACNILAEYVSGSVSQFIADMNARASELGCTGTHFSNCNGLEASDHYSTAYDFALIAREALRHSRFTEICGTVRYEVPATNMAEARELTNTNSLLNPDSEFYYEYAYGLKTGYFSNAGYCLVSAAAYNNIDVVCVVMGAQESGDNFRDTLTLFDWMYENYSYRQILSSTDTLLTVPVEMGTEDSTGVRADSAVSLVLPNDADTSGFKYEVILYHEQEGRDLEAPVNAGDVLGEVSVISGEGDEKEIYGTSYLVATTTVDMSRLEYLRTQTKELFQTPTVRRIITLLLILFVIYILLTAFYYTQRIRHLRSVREAKRERARCQIQEEDQWLDIPDEDEDDLPQVDYYDDDLAHTKRKIDPDTVRDNYFDSFFKS